MKINKQSEINATSPDKTPSPCKATTVKGVPCRAPAGPSGYCAHHDPAREVARTNERVLGGTKKAFNKTVEKLATPRPEFKLDGPGDVIDMLKSITREVYETPTTARFDIAEKARAIAYVSGVLLKAYELTDVDERLSLLEAQGDIN